MNLKRHFGDSYDIVKRSLLQWLSPFGPWSAHPMFTHEVTAEEAAAFSRLLGVPVVSTETLLPHSDRRKYLAACEGHRSVFLDPDTGVRLHRREPRRSTEFVFAGELVDLTTVCANGLVLVFEQSVARGSERKHVQAKLDHFADQGVAGFAYISQASFLVLGKSSGLVQEAQGHLLAASDLPEARFARHTD